MTITRGITESISTAVNSQFRRTRPASRPPDPGRLVPDPVRVSPPAPAGLAVAAAGPSPVAPSPATGWSGTWLSIGIGPFRGLALLRSAGRRVRAAYAAPRVARRGRPGSRVPLMFAEP